MVKTITISFVAAIVATLAGYYLCQSEAFVLHYCALIFVTVFGATICTCAFWEDFSSTLEGYDADSRKTLIGDNIAFTVMAWLLPIGVFAMGLIK